jgi:glycosyltransferase involved in cell wall biosynthesis
MIRVLEFADIVNRYDFIDNIVRYADRRRFELTVCVRSEDSNIARPEYGQDVKYFYLPGNSRRDAPMTAYKLAQILRQNAIDILHTHHYEQAIVGWMATRLCRRTKLVIGRHYSDAIYRNPNPIKRKALLAIEQRINRDAARIIVPSQMILEILTRRQSIPAEKIDLVHYGFEPKKYNLPSEDEIDSVRQQLGTAGVFSIANFSRYHEEKGHVYLIRAAAKIREKTNAFKIFLIGEGAERFRLEEEIKRLGLEDNVVLTGWRRDAMAIMAAVDAIAQSTLQEAFSQVMCEAMWMRKPLIMTDVSGAADVIEDGFNGLIVPKADSDALADAIIRLMQNADLRLRLGKNGFDTIQNRLSIDRQIALYEDSFEKAMRS